MHTDQQAATLQSAADEVDLDVDLLFEALTSPRRRFVLARLQQAGSPLGLSDLADDVACWELDCETPVPNDTKQGIYVSLHHIHLPKLSDAGLIRYDQDTSTVETTEAGENFAGHDCLPRID